MEDRELPEDVLRFLRDRVDSVPHLEALLLFWERPERHWTSQEMASRLYLSAEATAQLIEDLVRQGLAEVAGEAPVTYRYATAWDESGLMARVAATYSRQLVTVAQLLHAKASPGVREFARAFHLKKDRS